MYIYQLIGRNLDITDAMRSYAEEKLAKLDRFSDQIVDSKVVMSYNDRVGGAPAKVEVQINVPNGIVRAEERGMDTYSAIDLVVDKLERQLKKHKGRVLARRGQEKPEPLGPAPEGGPEPVPAEPEEEEEEAPPQIVRTKRHVMRPMAPEDAAMELEALGHDFYVFRNLDTDAITVIYRREDGHYGLIEPA